MDTLLLALIADRLALLQWMKTKDAEKGRNKPESLFKILYHEESTEKDDDAETFTDIADFEKRRQEILKEVTNG